MSENLFKAALARKNTGRPPVWFMRQAGRYHSHYQNLKKTHSFIDLCKKPDVACETTMGPIRDFDFDAAILFSDLLFPLEAMGMGLTYNPGPELTGHLKTIEDVKRLQGGLEPVRKLQFQAEAMKLIRAALPESKGLLGFVGGPMTLFFYAVEGSHQGELREAKEGLTDGRFELFMDKISDLLAANMALQARAGADTVAMLDTTGGEVDPTTYGKIIVPAIKEVLEKFKKLCPDTPVTYYSKKTGPKHWKPLRDLPIDCLGIDWKHDLVDVLSHWTDRFTIQGNIDPHWLLLDKKELENRLLGVFYTVADLPSSMLGAWVCGLGHGVLKETPEENVKLFLRLQKKIFGGS